MKLPVLFLLSCLLFAGYPQNEKTSDTDSQITALYKTFHNERTAAKSVSQVMIDVAEHFIGTPYVASTLETDGNECLVTKLDGFDCTTFVENVLAFGRYIKGIDSSADAFKKELTNIRYRKGVINLYPSRLHYFSDWIYDNSKKKIVSDAAHKAGGDSIWFHVEFMSTHPNLYKHLKENPAFIDSIKLHEKAINKRKYFYIPQNKIAALSDSIKSGDIIAFTTSVEGLDVSHTGLAYRNKKGELHLLHAGGSGKVQISEKKLSDFAKGIKKNTGIMVVRPREL